MHRWRKELAVCVLVIIAAGAGLARQSRTGPLRLVDPRDRGAAALQTNPAGFGWLLFAYLAWPAVSTERGVPDGTKQIGAAGPTVWETFKSTTDVYLANGAKPSPWNAPSMTAASSEFAPALATLGAVDSAWVHFLSESVMIDGRQIVDTTGQIVQYEVRMNLDAFNYVVNNPAGYPLYNLEGQQAALADPAYTFQFPQSALEVKAAWRVLEPGQDDSRYWTSYGIFTDNSGNPRLAKIGLTGLHIISKVLPDWAWFTFEQVDTPTATFHYFEGQKGAALGPNQTFNPAATAINKEFQAVLAGTKWQYYALMGWQTTFVDTTGVPTLLANTQAETYFQETSSCITCHSLSSIGPPSSPRLSFWNTSGGNIVGYTGTINFQAIAQQQYPNATFKPMDYAWSFRNAKSTKAPR